MTRRHLQIALGLLWLLDGALQLQPFMLGAGFANDVIAPTAAGQPHFVGAAVQWGASMIAAHPVAWDLSFAAVQLLIGLGLLVPPPRGPRSPPRSPGRSACGSSARAYPDSPVGTRAC